MTKPSRHKRGLGTRHDAIRTRLLAHHVEGSPCFWCGKPMHREAIHNWDGYPLAADHSTARAEGGLDPDRLLHFRCNSQRGKGDRDHLRPALGEQTPQVLDDRNDPQRPGETAAEYLTRRRWTRDWDHWSPGG
ncbi:MAG: hypothetical protein WAX14_07145 [Rhodococcus sp. (in: high G+C Gram-positive bacteria)]|uniref:hypothetical protein n=1 Tax=Rhodococcus sp. TaxID=1831 RepID=UPI003BB6E9AB